MFNKPLSSHLIKKRSRFTLSLLEIWCGLYLFINSLIPLVDGQSDAFLDKSEDLSGIQVFLNGTGYTTSGFWLRIFAIGVGLAMVVTPFFGTRFLKVRALLDFAAFVLFCYVGILITIYVPLETYFWIAPLISGMVCATVYLGNKAELRYIAFLRRVRLANSDGG